MKLDKIAYNETQYVLLGKWVAMVSMTAYRIANKLVGKSGIIGREKIARLASSNCYHSLELKINVIVYFYAYSSGES